MVKEINLKKSKSKPVQLIVKVTTAWLHVLDDETNQIEENVAYLIVV